MGRRQIKRIIRKLAISGAEKTNLKYCFTAHRNVGTFMLKEVILERESFK